MTNLFIPVILGTVRQGRKSEAIARAIVEQTALVSGVETELIDIRTLPIPVEDAGLTAQIPGFAETVRRADGYIIVVPEYNHTYPGLLKHVLDLNYKEYVHKAVGLCGVSAGAFGGVRAIESLLPALKAFGMLPTVADLNISHVDKVLDEAGQLIEPERSAFLRRFERFIKELVWLSTTLKHGRDTIPLGY